MNRKCYGKICDSKSKQFFSSIRSTETHLVDVIVLDVVAGFVVDVVQPADLFVAGIVHFVGSS